jgi:hypothetical protein
LYHIDSAAYSRQLAAQQVRIHSASILEYKREFQAALEELIFSEDEPGLLSSYFKGEENLDDLLDALLAFPHITDLTIETIAILDTPPSVKRLLQLIATVPEIINCFAREDTPLPASPLAAGNQFERSLEVQPADASDSSDSDSDGPAEEKSAAAEVD